MRIALFGAAFFAGITGIVAACSGSDGNVGGSSSGTTTPPNPPAPLNPPPNPPNPNPPGPPPPPPPPPADAGLDGPCNAVVQQGNPVERIVAAPPAPPTTGGTIIDGTYVLIAYTHYTSAKAPGTIEGTNEAQTLDVVGGVIQEIGTSDAGVIRRENDPYTVADGGLHLTQSCRNPGPPIDGGVTFPYNATSTTLELQLSLSATDTTALTYTKK